MALAGIAGLLASAQADFGVREFDVAFSRSEGSFPAQAGSHPFAVTFALGFEHSGEETEAPLRDLRLDWIPGLVANAASAPRCVAEAFLDESGCADVTALGIAASSDELDEWEARPVFNLTTPEGEDGAPLWLGFRLAGGEPAVAKVGIASEPPHNFYLEFAEIPESADPFGLVLQLWGVPADSAHDPFRGACGVGTKAHSVDDVAGFVFDVSAGPCPANAAQMPLLTLPTSCDGPAESSYEVRSWEGAIDSGDALTHGRGGEPLGFARCGALAFGPFVNAGPTSSAAASPTGFELSLDLFDEGLGSPVGVAESQVRDLVLDLPAGTSVDSSPAATCSEAQILDELAASGLGDACPAGSEVGELELGSPLLAVSIPGAVYRAGPAASSADATLYAVLKDASLGIAILQLVEIESDPETGRPTAYAEDLPQLPFSHLGLSLHGGSDALLTTPPRCGDYELKVKHTPWAEEDWTYVTAHRFSLDSGPDGGPCPAEAGGNDEDDDSSNGQPPQAVAPVEPILGPVFTCPRGKRAIRRNGVRHCVRRCPKGKRHVPRKGGERCVRRCRRGKRFVAGRRGKRGRCVRRCARGKRLARRKGKPRCVKRGRKGTKRRRGIRRR